MKISHEKEIVSQIVSLLKSLVSFKTTSDNLSELNRCVDFVKDYFSGSDAFVKKFVSNKKPSLVVTTKNTKKPDVFFVAHLDVVPADDSDFEAKVVDEKVFGRGALDNKGSAAVLIILTKEIAKMKDKPSIGLMLTTDEEVGGADGVAYLVKQGFRSKFVVVPDAGKDVNYFVFKEKGILRLKISAEGKAAHGSRPWEGVNAIEKLIDAYGEIKRLFTQNKKGHWHKTINLGKISGGSAINVVPSYAEMFFDIRFTERDSVKELLKKIKQLSGLKVEVLESGDAFITPTKNDYLQKLVGAVKKVTNEKTFFRVEHGASDIRHFANYNIPGILFMPKGSNAHSKNEFVVVSSLIDFYRIVKIFGGQL